MGVKNYISMLENDEAAEEEIQRLVQKNFIQRISKEDLLDHFTEGTLSRLALISKLKDSGWKHRIIADLLRSGGNSRALVPERIILPRIADVIRGVQEVWAKIKPEHTAEPTWGVGRFRPQRRLLPLWRAPGRDQELHLAIHSAGRVPHLQGDDVRV